MSALYAKRRRSNFIATGLCYAAAALGVSLLFLVLGMLVVKGLSGLSPAIFTEFTPPPGVTGGGLLNAIVGWLIITGLGILIGGPLGLLAGTYMAEYGQYSKLTKVVRFINDVLLSAPSIVIGLFIYELFVAPLGHYSAWAGSLALALLAMPVVVRTTENMLLLVPGQLREAGAGLGMPRWLIIRFISYRAARAGLITGVLLAVARISGETAPLIFTVLGNQFWSMDLNAPMSSLPLVIYKFANNPDQNWQQLAWTGALLITFTVLLLSVVARTLSHRKA